MQLRFRMVATSKYAQRLILSSHLDPLRIATFKGLHYRDRSFTSLSLSLSFLEDFCASESPSPKIPFLIFPNIPSSVLQFDLPASVAGFAVKIKMTTKCNKSRNKLKHRACAEQTYVDHIHGASAAGLSCRPLTHDLLLLQRQLAAAHQISG